MSAARAIKARSARRHVIAPEADARHSVAEFAHREAEE
jgi:hypothetical protein